MTKQELQARVNELELTLNSLELNAKTVKEDLYIASLKLESVNRPKITKEIVELIREGIETVLHRFEWDEPKSYEYEFEIGYDNQLSLGSINFENQDQLAEALSDEIENIFNIIEDEDEK